MTSRLLETISLFLAELIGTAMLVLLGCMSCLPWNGPPNPLQTSISFGLVVMIIIQIFGCVSGAHLNPAVTVAAVVYNQLTAQMACVYIVAQVFGAFMGYGLLLLMTPAHIVHPEDMEIGLCVTRPIDALSPLQALGFEYLATTVLIALCCGCWDPRNANKADSTALKFGFAIVSIGSILGPFTGASMNPARSLGPALWNFDFTSHWIYWVGPLPAGLITSIVYKRIFGPDVGKAPQVTDDDRKVNPNDNIPLKNVV